MAIERVRRNGSYAPLSATYFQDDDIVEAGEVAELLFLRALAYCAGRPSSDGFVSEGQVHRFVAVGMADVDKRIEALVNVGLWEAVQGGFVIRSWLKWNKSAEELGQYRARDRDRKREKTAPDVRSDAVSEAVADSARSADRIPTSAPIRFRSDSERKSEDPPETLPEPDKMGQEIPLGLRSDSDTHYTSLHDTSLHTHTLAEPARESVDPPLNDTATPPPPPPTKRPRRPADDLDNDPDFSAFWQAYPRKVDKGHARKTWAARVAAGANPQTITTGAQRYRDNPRRPTEDRYIPHPATWLNGERWTDEDTVTPPPPRQRPFWDN